MSGRVILAVVTRTGSAVHGANLNHRLHARTFCGKEWTDLNYHDVSESAIGCPKCRAAIKKMREADTDA